MRCSSGHTSILARRSQAFAKEQFEAEQGELLHVVEELLGSLSGHLSHTTCCTRGSVVVVAAVVAAPAVLKSLHVNGPPPARTSSASFSNLMPRRELRPGM